MKKKLALLVSVLVIAFLGFVVAAFAQEATVYGDGILVRAYIGTTDTNGQNCTAGYSAFLQVWGNDGKLVPDGTFSVVGMTLSDNTKNPVQIHSCDLTDEDIGISYDASTKTVYVMCTNANPGTHIMAYTIGLTSPPPPTPVNGECGSANGQTLTQAPSGSSLCDAGTPTTVSGIGPWTWSCQGSNGGSTANCSANIQTSGSPDLTISASGFGSSYNVGDSMNISITVSNQGNGSAGPSVIKVWQNAAGGADSGDLLYTGNVSTLGAGQSSSFSVSLSPSSACPIHYRCAFVFKADANNQVTESNESNNTYTRWSYRGR